MARRASDALGSQRQSRSAGFQAGRRQRHVAAAAGAYHSRQHDGPGDDLHVAAGLVSDPDDGHHYDDDREAASSTVGDRAAAEQPAGASLNFRVSPRSSTINPTMRSNRGLSSPLNVAYLWVIEFSLIDYVQ